LAPFKHISLSYFLIVPLL